MLLFIIKKIHKIKVLIHKGVSMGKKVKYNGGKDCICPCSSPSHLKLNKIYEVCLEKDLGVQTNFTLKGVRGEYNSMWFDVIEKAIYLATSYESPKIVKRFKCYAIEEFGEGPEIITRTTSPVLTIEVIDSVNDVYKITTRNSVYIVNIL